MDGLAEGKIINNWDEDHPGEVLVEYSLAEPGGGETKWVPVMTGYAGPGYGAYFFPEIGAKVILAFLYGDKNCPLVLGCRLGGVNTLPEGLAGDGNHKKQFRTTSGYEITLDEEEETLSFHDKESKNKVDVASKDGLITVEAEQKLTVRFGGEDFLTLEPGTVTFAGDVIVKAKSLSVEPEDALTLKGDSVTLEPAKDVTIKGQNLSAEPTSKVELKGQSLEASPTQSVKLSSMQVSVEGTTTEIKAKMKGSFEANGMMSVKGSLLQLN